MSKYKPNSFEKSAYDVIQAFYGLVKATGRFLSKIPVGVWRGVTAPLTRMAQEPGTAPNENMVMTRVVKRLLGV